jgi:hypothetical protein
MPNAGNIGQQRGVPPRRHSPPPLVECGWENVPPVQLVVERGGIKTACVNEVQSLSNKQTKEVAPCLSMGLAPDEQQVRVPADPGSPPCDGVGGRERQTLQDSHAPTWAHHSKA